MRRISFAFVLLGLVGCYASEKMGKDIQDTSHDVNQGGIYMHKGGLGVYRPEPPTTPQLTSASMTKAPAATPAATVPAPAAAPVPAAAPPAPAKELPLPRKEEEPAATQWPATPPAAAPTPPPKAATPPLPNASDAGVSDHGAFSL
jgi:hypothetical protein